MLSKFITALGILQIFLILPCKSDLLIQHCNNESNVCIYNLISSYFNDYIMFKSNTSNGNVKDIYFENSNVPPLEKIFAYFPHLEHFVIEHSELKLLNRSSFENATNLKVLRVQYNQIEKLTQRNFELATQLYEIRLDYNKISEINLNTFIGCENVTILSLQHNLIENISSTLLESMPLLNYLDMSYNRIQIINSDIFKRNPELKTIILNNNRIVEFDSWTFTHFEHLEYLDLSSNVIIEIWLQSVNKLVLNNAVLKGCHINGSTEVLIANNNFLRGIDIHDASELRILELRNNSIDNIANFSNAFLLEHLDVSANSLKILDAGKLFSYPRLISLKLAATDLSNLTDETFMFQNDVKELDLSHNYLKVITSGLIESMMNLEKLLISSNNLKYFDYKNLHNTHPHLKEIDLQYNEWNCTFLIDMLEYLQDNGIVIKTDFKHKIMKDKSQINGIFCEDVTLSSSNNELEMINKYVLPSSEKSQDRKENTLNILILIVVLIILVLQTLKFVKYYVTNRSNYKNIERPINHSRLIEETEHL